MSAISLAKFFVILGLVLILIGGGIYLLARLNIPLGKLPGDIRIAWGNVTCFFPIVTMLLISLILTVVLNLFLRIIGRK